MCELVNWVRISKSVLLLGQPSRLVRSKERVPQSEVRKLGEGEIATSDFPRISAKALAYITQQPRNPAVLIGT